MIKHLVIDWKLNWTLSLANICHGGNSCLWVKLSTFLNVFTGIDIIFLRPRRQTYRTGLIWMMMSVHVHLGVKKLSVWRLAGMSTVHGLSLEPIMQQRCGDWVIPLNRLPGKATGSLLGPRVSTRGNYNPPQIPTQIKAHWWHHRLPSSLKKHPSGLPLLACAG